MTQELAPFLGNSSSGDLTVSSDITETAIDSVCTTLGAKTLTVGSGLSFAAGQLVRIDQIRGTGAGNWEFARVQAYSGTTLTLETNLINTYNTSGSDCGLVRVVPQYRNITIDTGFTYQAKDWDGQVGGLFPFVWSGTFTINGILYLTGKGFRGVSTSDWSGEGTNGPASSGGGQNGNGAGTQAGAAGSGGGNGTAGADGDGASGKAGTTSGVAALTTMTFGGAGSTGGAGLGGGVGGEGGGMLLLYGNKLVMGSSGQILLKGTAGGNSAGRGAGGGAGGSMLAKVVSFTQGSGVIDASGGAGGTGSDPGGSRNGGAGGVGRIRIECCSAPGGISTTPAASTVIGGKPWCGSLAQIV